MTELRLPVVDVSGFAPGRSPEPTAVTALDEACRRIGFFAIVGHGVEPELLDELVGGATRFFALPTEEKERLSIERSAHHTGYVPMMEERLQADLEPDMKEAVDLALEPAVLGSGEPSVNPWPAGGELDPLRGLVVRYQAAALAAARAVARGLAAALDLDPGFFTDAMARPQCNLRLLHYPPAPDGLPDDQLGCGAHSDYGLVTLLATDGVPGLELQTVDGTWVTAVAPPGALVVNLGDMLARWTNDRYVSNLHRVTNQRGAHRYSVPFFVNPDPDTVVAVLPSCVDAERPARYEPVRAGDYLASRFDATHAYRVDAEG